MYVSSFHFISPCFVMSIFQMFWSCFILFQFFLYILIVSFVTKQKWVYKKKKKKKYVSSFHFVSPCFVMSIFQIFWSVSSCFRIFPMYLNRFFVMKQKWVYNKKENKKMYVSFRFILFLNEHNSNFLVCFILFQSFSYISYSFHLLRNRNGFKKKKDVCFIVSFYFTLFRNEH